MTNEEAAAVLLPGLAARRIMAAAGVLDEISWAEWLAREWSDDDEAGRAEWEDYNAHVREDAVGDHLANVAMAEALELAITALGGNPDDADGLLWPRHSDAVGIKEA